MRIIYRMRGLLGDATEEFVENLDDKDAEDLDSEEVYKLANVMSTCGGLEVMLERLNSIKDVQCSKQLLTVLLKLFDYCLKVRMNRERLLEPNLRAIPIFVQCLHLCLESESFAAAESTLSEQILYLMEELLVEAAKSENLDFYKKFAVDCTSMDDIESLLQHAVHLKSGTVLHQRVMRVLPFLTYGHELKMSLVVDHFIDTTRYYN